MIEVIKLRYITFLVTIISLYHNDKDKYTSSPIESSVFYRVVETNSKFVNSNLVFITDQGKTLRLQSHTDESDEILLKTAILKHITHVEKIADLNHYESLQKVFNEDKTWVKVLDPINLNEAVRMVNEFLEAPEEKLLQLPYSRIGAATS